MSAQFNQFTPELRDTLNNLAVGLFDLDAWIKEPDKYAPPEEFEPENNDSLPWRDPGGKLSMTDLRVIEFFENLLRESSGDDDLGARWSGVTANPLKFSPLADPVAWRKNRGLGYPPKFGVAASNNVWLTDGGKVISRATFYVPCWPLLKLVVDARKKAGASDWALLAKDLLSNNAPQWPTTAQPTSSSFLVQFASDMVYAMLGQRNPLAGAYERAVLAELGEHRYPGNDYTRSEVAKAVKAFEKAVKEFEQAARPAAQGEAQHGTR